MGALPEVVCMRDRGWEKSVQDMSRNTTFLNSDLSAWEQISVMLRVLGQLTPQPYALFKTPCNLWRPSTPIGPHQQGEA